MTIGIENGGYILEDLDGFHLSSSSLKVEEGLEEKEEGRKEEVEIEEKEEIDMNVALLRERLEERLKEKKKREGSFWRLVRLLRGCLKRSSFVKILGYVLGVIVQTRVLISHSMNSANMMGCVFSLRPLQERKREFYSQCVKVFCFVLFCFVLFVFCFVCVLFVFCLFVIFFWSFLGGFVFFVFSQLLKATSSFLLILTGMPFEPFSRSNRAIPPLHQKRTMRRNQRKHHRFSSLSVH